MNPKRPKLTRFQWNAIVDVHELGGRMQVLDGRRLAVFRRLCDIGLLRGLRRFRGTDFPVFGFTAKGRALMRRQHWGAP